MTNTFKSRILKNSSDIDYLPICHTTDGFHFREIISKMKLKVQNCKVFSNKDLVYSFYGKPSYRKRSNLNYYDLARLPVCIMLALPKQNLPYKIFPFDSGAFVTIDEIRNRYFHPNMKLEDFNLGNDTSILKNAINYFYSSNGNYIRGNPNDKIDDIYASDFELKSYHNLIKEKSASLLDDRIKTFEISYENDILLDKKNVIKIIIPNSFMMDSLFMEDITKSIPESKLLPYYSSMGNLDSFHGSIVDNAFRTLINEII